MSMNDNEKYIVVETLLENEKLSIYRVNQSQNDHIRVLKTYVSSSSSPTTTNHQQGERYKQRLRNEYEVGCLLNDVKHTVEYCGYIENRFTLSYPQEIIKESPAVLMNDCNIGRCTPMNFLIPQDGFVLETFFHIATELTEGMKDMHDRGIIYMEIKPENTMMSEGGLVKYTVYELASAGTDEKHVNVSLFDPPSLPYTSPEQTGFVNRLVDRRSDMYGLGIMFYQLLTGKLPFNSDIPMEIIRWHLDEKATIPLNTMDRREKGKIPMILLKIIQKLVRRNPVDRYQSCRGLLYDLHRYKELLQDTTESISSTLDFELGTNDTPDKVFFNGTVYGRDDELQILFRTFRRVVELNRSEIVWITGARGIGKTSTVNELQKYIVLEHGYFLSMICDPMKKDIPYSWLTGAMNQLVVYIRNESQERVKMWKKKILDAVGKNGKLLIDIIPDLEEIIGIQPEVQQLSPVEANRRFTSIFQRFISVVQKENPLVLFSDDINHIDSSSLDVLQIMLKNENTPFLFIGSYQEDKMEGTQTGISSIRNLAPCYSVDLYPLSIDDISKWVSTIFSRTIEHVQPLVASIYRKTKGNPALIRLLLETMTDENRVYKRENVWQYESVPDSILSQADIIMKKCSKLPDETQKLLNFMCCLGSSISIDTVSFATGESIDSIRKKLRPAEDLNLVYTVEENISFNRCIHEIIYQRLDTSDELNIRKTIASNLSQDNETHQKYVFECASNMNNVAQTCYEKYSDTEYIKLFWINNMAGEKAARISANKHAIHYLSSAISWMECLKDGPESSKYRTISYNTHQFIASVYHAEHEFQLAQSHIQVLLDRAQIPEEFIELESTIVNILNSQGKTNDAIQRGVSILLEHGMKLPTTIDECDRVFETEQYQINSTIKQYYSKKNEDQDDDVIRRVISSLTYMKDRKRVNMMKLLNAIASAASNIQQRLFEVICAKAVSMSLRFGLTSESALFFAYYGHVIVTRANRNCTPVDRSGYLISTIGVQLAANKDDCILNSKVNYIFGTLVNHWYNHFSSGAKICQEAAQYSNIAGDDNTNISARTTNLFLRLMHSATTEETLAEFYSLVENVPLHKSSHNCLRTLGCWICKLVSKPCNDNIYYGRLYDSEDWTAVAQYNILKAISYYLNDNSEITEAYKHMTQASRLLRWVEGQYYEALFSFYYALILIRMMHNSKSHPLFSNNNELLIELNIHKKKLQIWSETCPSNFQHKYLLVQAEIKNMNGECWEASELYDQAIEKARKNGSLIEYALTNELAGKLWIVQSKPLFAKIYIDRAYDAYSDWCATRKRGLLKRKYFDVMHSMSRGPVIAPKQLFSQSDFNQQIERSSQIASAYLNNITPEMKQLIHASNILTSTIDLQTLLGNILTVVSNILNIERGAIILGNLVEAEYYSKDTTDPIKTLMARPLTEWRNGCVTMVNHVSRTLQTIVTSNATEDPLYLHDIYVQKRQPKSIVCMPLIRNFQLVAILYVESSYLIEELTEDSIGLLAALSDQICMQLKNAIYFRDQLHTAQQIADIERKRALDAESYQQRQEDFVDNICHEIRNPVFGILGNVDLLKSSMQAITQSKTFENDPAVSEQINNFNDGLKAIEICANHQKVITDDVLTLSKLEANKIALNYTVFKPTEIALSSIGIFHPEIMKKQLNLITNLPDKNVAISGDPTRINQVLINLLSNAVKFTARGDITVSISIQENMADPSNVTLSISVEDTGLGMTNEEVSHLFQRFEQASRRTQNEYGGSGLGLFISKHLVGLMGGTITVESKKFSGSKFSFTVQCKKCKQNESDDGSDVNSNTANDEVLPSNMKVLIVEDNPINQRILVRMLEQEGHSCYVANNGLEAVESYKQHCDQLDIILMDIELPVMNGLEATTNIRKIEKERSHKTGLSSHTSVPIIGLSGNARSEHVHNALNIGMQVYLTKPIAKIDLYDALSTCMKRK
jgi:predicted ATPase/signal transduction histidine kinase/AmiR/NasT family two-component response regulator